MSWQSLRVAVERDGVESISDLLLSYGAVSITLTDAKDEPLLEPGPDETPLWQEAHVTALFEKETPLDTLITALQAILPGTTLTVEEVPDQAWERICLADVKPMQFGKSLWVVPSHWDGEWPQGHVMVLDPGLAFGTGTHPTTRLMLQFLDGYDCRGRVIVDYGCGSGILSVAAAVMGAARVLGVDYDPQALLATRDNALKNNCAELITVALPEQYHLEPADLVLANIILEPLIDLHDTLKSLLKPGGLLVMSGILAEQEAALLARYSDFTWVDTTEDEGWVRVIVQCRLTQHQ